MAAKKFINIGEFCLQYGVTRSWVYKRPDAVLPRVKFNGKPTRPLLFDREVVEKLFSTNKPRSLTILEVEETSGIDLPPKEILCL